MPDEDQRSMQYIPESNRSTVVACYAVSQRCKRDFSGHYRVGTTSTAWQQRQPSSDHPQIPAEVLINLTAGTECHGRRLQFIRFAVAAANMLSYLINHNVINFNAIISKI